jgi:hypothetical protein
MHRGDEGGAGPGVEVQGQAEMCKDLLHDGGIPNGLSLLCTSMPIRSGPLLASPIWGVDRGVLL